MLVNSLMNFDFGLERYMGLYAPQICFFLPANNSNSSYYKPFMKILDLYVRLIFSDSLFVILLNKFLIVVLNSINMGEKKENIFCIFTKRN